MFVPGLTATGWPLTHSFTTKGGAGSPIRPPNPVPGARTAIKTKNGSAYFIIIPYEFIHGRSLAQVPIFARQNRGASQFFPMLATWAIGAPTFLSASTHSSTPGRHECRRSGKRGDAPVTPEH